MALSTTSAGETSGVIGKVCFSRLLLCVWLSKVAGACPITMFRHKIPAGNTAVR